MYLGFCRTSMTKLLLPKILNWFCKELHQGCWHGPRYVLSHRKSNPDVFLQKGVLKICSKFTGEHPCRSMISTKLLCNFIEIKLRHWCSPVNLLHISRIPFPRNTSEGLLLSSVICVFCKIHWEADIPYAYSCTVCDIVNFIFCD